MHPLDRIAQIGMRARPWVGRVFPDGFGDEDHIGLVYEPIDPAEPIPPVDIRWDDPIVEPLVTRTTGRFDSPYADLLHAPARTGSLELVEPHGGARRVVLLYPSYGEETFWGRRRLARRLANEGIASLLLMNPLFGPRRIHDGSLPIRTVADICLQAYVTVREGRALMAAQRHDRQVGFAGFSMGAGFSVATSMVLPWPAAIAAATAAPSPARTFTTGILGSRLDPSFDQADRRRIFEILDAPGATHREPLPHHADAVLLAPQDDGFVDPEEARVLHRHWEGSELREVPGGHGSTWLFGQDRISRAIVDAFDRAFA